jgi:RNA polymerase sigma factor (sigma-70 family)
MAQNNYDQLSDAELVQGCLAGDKVAFTALINRHQLRLKRLLRVILSDWPEIDDVWQETVLRAYLNLEQLRQPARFGAWLCSIAINLARTQRRAAFLAPLSWEGLNEREGDEIDWLDPGQPIPEAEVIKQELGDRVQEAIADLPAAEREAVMLVYFNELSHKEAALQLSSSLSAVKVRVHRGRSRLRTTLQSEFGPSLAQQQFKEKKMIKVKVYDLMIVSPQDQQGKPNLILGNLLNPKNRILLLKEETGDRALAIWLDSYDIRPITSQLEQRELKRPMTFELTKTLLEVGGVVVDRVLISHLDENTFYGIMTVKTSSTVSEIDCRPSDAINLALRLDVPIFVDAKLMREYGFTSDTQGHHSWAAYLASQLSSHSRTDE